VKFLIFKLILLVFWGFCLFSAACLEASPIQAVEHSLPQSPANSKVEQGLIDKEFETIMQDGLINSFWSSGDRTQAPAGRLRPVEHQLVILAPQKLRRSEPRQRESPPAIQEPSAEIKEINALFDSLESPFPAELLKAIAWVESRWHHTDKQGNPVCGINYRRSGRALFAPPGRATIDSIDWGIMQINDRRSTLDPLVWDFKRIKTDMVYNIHAGIQVLKNKLALAQRMRASSKWRQLERAYQLYGYSDLEVAIKAYNGLQYSSIYVDQINRALLQRPWEKGSYPLAKFRYVYAPMPRSLMPRDYAGSASDTAQDADLNTAILEQLPEHEIAFDDFLNAQLDKPGLEAFKNKRLGDVDARGH
jgi:hypothetical protein